MVRTVTEATQPTRPKPDGGSTDDGVDAMLDALAARLKEAVGCDGVFTHEWIRHGRALRFAEVWAGGDPAFRVATRRLEGRSAFDYLSPTDPAASETWPGELWRLDHVSRVGRRTITGRGAHRMHWAPVGITSTLGFQVGDGGAVLGGICAVRLAASPPFDRRARDAARRIQVALGDAFVTACRARAHLAGAPGDRSTLAFDEDGELLGGGLRTAPWLTTPSTIARLSALARRVAAEGIDRETWFVRRAPVRFERLVGRRPLVVACVVEGDRYRPGTRERLTPTQRQVADLVVVGATIAEVARSLGNRPSTVHHHLKGIYQRLGIGSRTELARLLEPPPPRSAGTSAPTTSRS